MTLLLAALAVLLAGGVAALAAARRPGLALAVGSWSAAAGSLLGLVAAAGALRAPPVALDLPWPVPNGALALGLDPLSALFAAAVFALGLAAAVFGAGYMRSHVGHRPLGAFAFFFNLLVASMALVAVARQAVLFLVAWEVMTIASFQLVAFEHEDGSVRRAARIYLVASHLGAAALFALFLALGAGAGSLRFDAFAAARGAGLPAGLLFGLAVIGFGTKAGLVPLHVWLPEAHPAAPSHVSALMSGVLVKLGVYGILRTVTFLPPPPLAHGLALAAIGLAGAVAALALATTQRDLKRVLAYSTIENVGIISLAAGLGLAGAAFGSPGVAALGIAGALLHVWNHTLMKGLAFLCAGGLVHGAGTRDLERMGGLLRRLPATGALLVLAATALAGLPPLNGFVSEWLVYLGLLRGADGGGSAPLALLAWLALAALAFVGALAAVTFVRLLGIALLGEPRSSGAARAHEGGPLLVVPLALLGAGILAVALLPAQAIELVSPAAGVVLGTPSADVVAALAPAASSLAGPVRLGLGTLLVLVAGLLAASRRALSRRDVRASSTWGCGFSQESARVQYTAASFAELAAVATSPGVLRPTLALERPAGPFPPAARFATEADDPARARVFEPAFARAAEWFGRLRRFQQARLNLQLLYTVVTILILSALLFLGRSR